jgi:hypothetical protein
MALGVLVDRLFPGPLKQEPAGSAKVPAYFPATEEEHRAISPRRRCVGAARAREKERRAAYP